MSNLQNTRHEEAAGVEPKSRETFGEGDAQAGGEAGDGQDIVQAAGGHQQRGDSLQSRAEPGETTPTTPPAGSPTNSRLTRFTLDTPKP